MTPAIDEDGAWALLRAVEPGRTPARVHDPRRPDVWLDVERSGAWSASTGATQPARDLLDLFLPVRVPGDVVVAQLGQSLDGRIATESGDSRYVTGAADIRRLHRLRALVDAVVVGAGTVVADDPRLTVRAVEGDDPVRVVIDPSARLDPGLGIFSDGVAPTLWVVAAGAGAEPPSTAVETLVVPAGGAAGLDLPALLTSLRERGLRRILVEGGGVTVSRFLAAGLLDRLHVTVAPLLVGSGRPSLALPPITGLSEALRPPCRHFALGPDVLFDLDLRAVSESGRAAREG